MAFDLQILTVIYIYIFFYIFDQSFNFRILCGELTVCSNIGIVECLFSSAQAAVSKHYNWVIYIVLNCVLLLINQQL